MASELCELTSNSLVARARWGVWRWVYEAAEEVAARPRGQQLFRQMDRLLEMTERLARTLARALASTGRAPAFGPDDRRVTWGQTPMSSRTAIPLLVLVLPTFMLAVLLITVLLSPILIPTLIFGPLTNALSERDLAGLGENLPTPQNIASWMRLWRRRLRGVRFTGQRKMRFLACGMPILAEEEAKADWNKITVISTLLFWWPITVMALVGQILGLGGPFVPVRSSAANKRTLENSEVPNQAETVPLSDEMDVSPRKRKLYEFQEESLLRATNPSNESDERVPPAALHSTAESDEEVEKKSDLETDSSTECESDSDSGTLTGSVDFNKLKIEPKRLSPLASLLTDSPLSSGDEEDDPNYVPNSDELGHEDDTSEEGDDYDDEDDVVYDDDDDDDDVYDDYDEDIYYQEKETKVPDAKEVEKFHETKESEGNKLGKPCEKETEESKEKESKKCSEKETEESKEKDLEQLDEKKTKELEEKDCDKTLTPGSVETFRSFEKSNGLSKL